MKYDEVIAKIEALLAALWAGGEPIGDERMNSLMMGKERLGRIHELEETLEFLKQQKPVADGDMVLVAKPVAEVMDALAEMNADNALVIMRQDDYDELQRDALRFRKLATLDDHIIQFSRNGDTIEVFVEAGKVPGNEGKAFFNGLAALSDALPKQEDEIAKKMVAQGYPRCDPAEYTNTAEVNMEGYDGTPWGETLVVAAAHLPMPEQSRKGTVWQGLFETGPEYRNIVREYGERVPIGVTFDTFGAMWFSGETPFTVPDDGYWTVGLCRDAQCPPLVMLAGRFANSGDTIIRTAGDLRIE